MFGALWIALLGIAAILISIFFRGGDTTSIEKVASISNPVPKEISVIPVPAWGPEAKIASEKSKEPEKELQVVRSISEMPLSRVANQKLADDPDRLYTLVVFSPRFENDCGGIQVLFQIASVVAQKPGWRAFVCDMGNELGFENDLCNRYISIVDMKALNWDRTVVLYPEIVRDSPVPEAKHVVRLVLFKVPDVVRKTWRDTDMVLYFSSFGEERIDPDLLFYCIRERDLTNLKGLTHNGQDLFMWRKGEHFHTDTEIVTWMRQASGADSFIRPSGDFTNQLGEIASASRFFCADPYTYWSFLAAFVGVVSVVMPTSLTKSQWAHSLFLGDYLDTEFEPANPEWACLLDEFSLEEIRDRQPFGVAWGGDPREMLWAARTNQFAEEQHKRANLLGHTRMQKALDTWMARMAH